MVRTIRGPGPAPSPDPSAQRLELEVSAPVRFRFRCRGRRFDAEVASSAAGTVVRVVAEAGFIPYSAEAPDLRRSLLRELTTPPSGISVGPDQRILLRAEMPIEQPARPERVVATAAALALALGSGGILERFARLYDGAAETA